MSTQHGLLLRVVGVDDIRPLRHAVLRPGLPIEAAMWPGDDDPGALHVAVYPTDDPTGGPVHVAGPIGVVSLLPAAYPGPGGDGRAAAEAADETARSGRHPESGAPGYQLRGMAVAPRLQGRGVGSVLLRGALDELTSRGVLLVWCNARLSAAPFYERGGFVRHGGRYVLAPFDIVHVRMHQALSPG